MVAWISLINMFCTFVTYDGEVVVHPVLRRYKYGALLCDINDRLYNGN